MKSHFHSLLRITATSFLFLLSACSFHQKQASIQPVGPGPVAPASPEHTGYLVVYSAWSSFVDQGSTGHHSRYTISPADGSWTREIINHQDRFDEGPVSLPLAPGSYRLRARSTRFGRVTVPVVVQEHQTTFVYLDGQTHAQARSASPSSIVRLPDGEIVGWSGTVADRN